MSKDKGLLLPSSLTPTHCFNIAAMLRTDAERLKGLKVKVELQGS